MPYTATAFDVLSNVQGHKNRKRMRFSDLKPAYAISERSIYRVIHQSACLTTSEEQEAGRRRHLIKQVRKPKVKECHTQKCEHREFCPMISLPLFSKR